MLKKILPHLVLLAIAIVITHATTFSKVEVASKADLSALSCGWPFVFVVIDQSYRDPPYPWKLRCISWERGDTVTFLRPQFAANVASFYIVGLALLYGYRVGFKRS